MYDSLTYEFSSFIHQWTQLKTRKQNLTRLFQKMQSYQFEQISADPDKPLADGIRPLDTADMERYGFITLQDLKYVLHFWLWPHCDTILSSHDLW